MEDGMVGRAIKPAMSSNERRIVAYTSLAHALNHLIEISYPALLVFIAKEFGIGYLFLGAVANAAALAYGLTAPVGGFLSDRVGSKRMLWLQLGLGGVASLLVAASTNHWFLAVTLTLLGLASGIYHPVGLSFITRSVRSRAMATGYHGMAGNLAVAVAPAVAVAMAGIWNWRAAFVVYGAIGLLAAFLVMASRLREETPEKAAPVQDESTTPPGGRARNVARVMWPPLIAVLCANALGGFIYRGAVTYLPLHLTENLGLHLFGVEPATLAGYFATIALLFGIGGQYVGGSLGERLRKEYLVAPMALCVVPSLLLVGTSGRAWLVVGASAFAFFHFMAQPVYNALIADYTPLRLQGRIFGVAFLLGYGVGSFAATLGGYMAERGGTSGLFLSLAASQAVTIAAGAFLVISAHRKGKADAEAERAG
jgi:MFS family permease